MEVRKRVIQNTNLKIPGINPTVSIIILNYAPVEKLGL